MDLNLMNTMQMNMNQNQQMLGGQPGNPMSPGMMGGVGSPGIMAGESVGMMTAGGSPGMMGSVGSPGMLSPEMALLQQQFATSGGLGQVGGMGGMGAIGGLGRNQMPMQTHGQRKASLQLDDGGASAADIAQTLESLDRSCRLTSEMLATVQAMVDYVDKAGTASGSKKRSRADVSAVE
ncbi:hypothetical protein HK101_010536, partial [Irineochytrium annulatum]